MHTNLLHDIHIYTGSKQDMDKQLDNAELEEELQNDEQDEAEQGDVRKCMIMGTTMGLYI